jgi:hypothetical protein
MATQWFCKLKEGVRGPLTAAELKEKVRDGEVSGITLVRKDDSKWFPAKEVVGLFEAAFGDDPEKLKKAQETELPGDV